MGTPDEIIAKLKQIEEHAHAVLAEGPEGTARERLRLILGLAGYLRTAVRLRWPGAARGAATVEAPESDVVP